MQCAQFPQHPVHQLPRRIPDMGGSETEGLLLQMHVARLRAEHGGDQGQPRLPLCRAQMGLLLWYDLMPYPNCSLPYPLSPALSLFLHSAPYPTSRLGLQYRV
jgi:hypothetical protein